MLLNDTQRRAVEEQGIQLIVAGPGSGKTLVITEKVKHLLAKGVSPENILALTFSKKAAREMADRLEDAIYLDIDPSGISVSTFHSFCLELLKDNIFESGMSFTSNLFSRAHQLVWGLRNVDAFKLEHTTLGSNHSDVIESIIDGISTFRDELRTPEDLERYLVSKEDQELPEKDRIYHNKLGDLLKVWRAYEQFKKDEKLHDYDDMLIGSVDLFNQHPEILQYYRERFKHLLVDEFQDINYAQFTLIQQLAGDNVCVVGDDDQSIYRFRGAYFTNFEDFSSYFAPAEVLLNHNYRNSATIMECALQLMRSAPNRKAKPLVTDNLRGEKITVARCQDENTEATYVMEEVRKWVNSDICTRPDAQPTCLSYKHIAVLSRKRVEGAKIQAILQKNGIPAEFVGDVDFFAQSTIRVVLAYLEFASAPLTTGVALCLIVKELGVDELTIQRINTHALYKKKVEGESDGVFEAMLDAKTFLATREITKVAEIVQRLQQLLDLHRRVPLLEFVYEVITNFSGQYTVNLQQANIQDVQFLNKFYNLVEEYFAVTKDASLDDLLEYLGLLGQFESEKEETEERDSVKIMTAHQSKGTEFPIVFVIDLAEGKFPLSYNKKEFYVPRELSRGDAVEDDEDSLREQEERRLLYVAMTRAEHKLYLTYAEKYGDIKGKKAPSKFLLELNFDSNPLMEVARIESASTQQSIVYETPLKRKRRELQDQVASAASQLRLKTAFQGLINLEQIRLLEEGLGFETFSLDSIVAGVNTQTDWLDEMLHGTPATLIPADHHFSPTALARYMECPMKYLFQDVLKYPTKQSQAFAFGSFVHQAIHQLSLDELQGRPPTEWSAFRTLDALWPSSSAMFPSNLVELELRERAEQILAKYVAWNEANENTLIGTEVKFLFPLNRRNVTGKIDRVERTETGEYVIVDFKTGSALESKNTIQNSIQMNVYSLAMQHRYGALPKFAQLFYLEKRKTPTTYAPNHEQMQREVARLSDMIDNILDEQFHATPSHNGCKYCDYSSHCPTKVRRNISGH